MPAPVVDTTVAQRLEEVAARLEKVAGELSNKVQEYRAEEAKEAAAREQPRTDP